jgi:translation initiation factor 2 subunit 2
MKRDPDHVFRFFLAELGTTGSIDGNQRFMIKGKYVPKYIESLLKKYIAEYVTCHMCRGVDTKLVRDNVSRMYFMQCSSCGASRAVATIQKGYHATGRGERRAARNTAT